MLSTYNFPIFYRVLLTAFIGVVGFVIYCIFNTLMLNVNAHNLAEIKTIFLPVLHKVEASEKALLSLEENLKEAVAASEESFIEEADEQAISIQKLLGEISQLDSQSGIQVSRIEHNLGAYLTAAKSLTQGLIDNDDEIITLSQDVQTKRTKLKDALHGFRNQKAAQVDNQIDQTNADAEKIILYGIYFGIFLVILIFCSVWFLAKKGIIEPIRALVRASEEISSGNLEWELAIDSRDEFGYLAACFNNMTNELRQVKIDLESARDEALAFAEMKTQFVTNMSHEIRTPMNGVLGMLVVLQDEDLTPQQAQYVTVAKQSSESLLSLLNDLLDFAKVESGKMTLENIPFDPQDVLENVADIFSAKAREQGIELILSVTPNTLPKHIEGDPGRIQQILNNLISNAIKFTHHGHVIIEGKLIEKDEQAQLYCAVEDTGIGIPEEKKAMIFEEFSQADASTSRQYGGTGLGLAISRQLVSLMGGEMNVDCPTQGSRFWFTIPLSCHTAPHPIKSLDGRILVVDDNMMTLSTLSQQLISMGFQVDQQTQPEKALNMLSTAVAREQAYNLVMIDEEMPSMLGVDLLKHIKARPSLRETAVILLCTECSSKDIQVWTAMGIIGYISKPIKPSALVMIIDMFESMGSDNSKVQKPYLVEKNKPKTQQFGSKFSGHVLVVDDNEVNLMVAMTILERFGLKIDTAESGESALTKLTQVSYDLIFMDCQMPGLNGFETTERIRQQNTSIPVIAMTAEAKTGIEQQCLDAGMNGYVSKPVKVNVLEGVLAKWLSASKSASAQETQSEKDDTTQAMQELVDLFGAKRFKVVAKSILDSAPKQLNQIVTDWEGKDYAQLKASAHLFKGTMSVLKATQLCGYCVKLEASAEANNPETIPEQLEQIKTATAKFLDRLTRYA